MIAALVIGRKGSVGFPGKNLYPVHGKPLAWYPLHAALSASTVDAVYISTDDPSLMDLGSTMGAKVIERPARLCTKEALGEDAFVHGYYEILAQTGCKPELMVLLFANAPTLTPETIDRGIEIMRADPALDSAVTVSRYNMWSPLRARAIGSDGCLQPFVPLDAFNGRELSCDRDSQGDAWFADVAVSVVRPENLEQIEQGVLPQRWMGKRIAPILQDAGCDVDYEWQIPLVEWWIKRYNQKALATL